MSDHEVGQDGTTSGGSLDAPGPDVLLRTVVPPYRLGEVLLRIGELKLTGKLSLGSDMGRRTILVHSGFPVFTQSSLFAERLGAIGVRHGFFGREDVARALAHARDNRNGLGESLLELGYVNPQKLYALLGVQLREVVAASCGSAPQRARFQAGTAPLRDVVILRLHPMTAVLAAMASLPAVEQSKLLLAVGSRRLSAAPMPGLARQWLADLGYMGDAELLLNGEPQVSAMRGRLLARYRADAEKVFDPAQVPFAFAGTRVMVEPLASARVSELVTLTLLMSGALKFGDAGSLRPGRDELLATNTAESLQVALEDAVDKPIAETRASLAPGGESPADGAVEAYLLAKRERSVAAAAAVWGPSVEATDGSVPPQLLRSYLTLKPERRPEVVLGVAAGSPAELVMQAYASRTEMVAAVAQPGAGEHLRCRAAELSQRFDDALDAILPGTSGRASLPPPPARPAGSDAPEGPAMHAAAEPSTPPSAAPSTSGSLRSPTPPRDAEPSYTSSHIDARASGRSEALAVKVDALLRARNWRGVLDALDARATDPKKLPFTLQLARSVAQRQLAHRRGGKHWPWLLALLLGLIAGYAARHFGGPMPTSFQLPF